MKALIIAGGFGTRMRPLTYTQPKHLLPIANKPHIEHVFGHLQKHGINECVLLTSYLADAFEETVRNAKERGMSVEVAHEETPLGTAGALKNAESLLGRGTFLAMNGDVLTEANLSGLIRFHRDRGAEATILLTPVDDPTQFGIVPTDDSGRVQSFIEKPQPGEAITNMINAGVYVMERSVLSLIPSGEEHSSERQLFPRLVHKGSLYASATDAYWLDVGTPEKYLQANLDALEGRFVAKGISLTAEGSNVVAEGAAIHEGARIESSCIGPDCTIGADASVSRSVLLSDVRIGRGANVDACILGRGVQVKDGAVIESATLGDEDPVEKVE